MPFISHSTVHRADVGRSFPDWICRPDLLAEGWRIMWTSKAGSSTHKECLSRSLERGRTGYDTFRFCDEYEKNWLLAPMMRRNSSCFAARCKNQLFDLTERTFRCLGVGQSAPAGTLPPMEPVRNRERVTRRPQPLKRFTVGPSRTIWRFEAMFLS